MSARFRALVPGLAVALLVLPSVARAFCPSYTLGSTANTHNCGVDAANGTNPTVAEWNGIFTLVAGGPAAWGDAGPSVPDIGQGCGKPEPQHNVAAQFPCELLKAIAMQESSWQQFCVPDSPADQAHGPSRTIISFDCGYGVGQVTSGMHTGEMPAFDRAKVAGDATYNLAAGTLILADKWRATKCVGDNQPRIVEDWYVAAWAYNGLAFSNNPNNPNYSTTRGVCDTKAGCGARPYQEKIFGWMEHPPTAQHWAPLAPAYPDRADIPATGATVPNLPEPKCASPTDCTNTRTVHVSACLDGAGGDMATASGSDMAGGGSGGKGGCGCDLGRAPSHDAALVISALALLFALRYKPNA
jgi:hypothetical protein